MEFEPQRPDSFIEDESAAAADVRSKTSLRMRYEAEAEVIKRQIGDLEKIRTNLGLSARKICQLLMVDPSAWNRWTKQGESAPPHIYRALQWFFIANEKLPGLTTQYFIGGNAEQTGQLAALKMREEAEKIATQFRSELDSEAHRLETETKEREKLQVRMEYYKVISENGIRDLNHQIMQLEKQLRGERMKSMLLAALAGLLSVGVATLLF